MNRSIRDNDLGQSWYWTHAIQEALCARGLKTYHIADVFSSADPGNVMSVADLFAVHPAMRSI
jgi:hypothetical protein